MKKIRSLHILISTMSASLALLCTLSLAPAAFAGMTVPAGKMAVSLTPHIFQQQMVTRISQITASSSLIPCLASSASPRCYSPQQIRKSYNIQPLLDKGITGKGHTIVILDDYQSPTIRGDLKLFNKLFNLNDSKLNIIAPYGQAPFNAADPAVANFAGEISLDVEWAHAIAPDATIDLVLGNPRDSSIKAQVDALIKASNYAVNNHLGDVISLSVGVGETCYSQAQVQAWHRVFANARNQGMSVLVSSGDSGSAVARCDRNGDPIDIAQGVSYPGSDPLVTSVGGTTLNATRSGRRSSEIVWNDSEQGQGATGGGFSRLFARPTYQNGVPGIGSKRGVPDVSYNADPLMGVPIVTSSFIPGATVILPTGGTSAGTPQWAGLVALASQLNGQAPGFLNDSLYQIRSSGSYKQAFYDITSGNNGYATFDSRGKPTTIPGFKARSNWDPDTGLGSPQGEALAHLL
jgi:subtilase family serine protease